MKKLLLLTICLFSQYWAIAQEEWNLLKSDTSIEQTWVNKKMFQMMSNVKNQQNDASNIAYQNLLKKLEDLVVFSTKNNNASQKIINQSKKYIKNKDLQLLNTYKEAGENISFYVNKGATKNQISELVMLVEPIQNSETVVFILKGSFSLKEIASLAHKMKIPGTQVFDKI